MQLREGTILQNGKYRIEKVLGQGSFGITYLATTKVKLGGNLGDMEAVVKVAVKEFFMRDLNGREGSTVTYSSRGELFDKYKKKFIKEAQNLSRLSHPNIIKVLDLFEANGTYYYVMKYCECGSLDERIRRSGGLSESETLRYSNQIGSALGYMHSKKMLHLDLKPGNIMLDDKGNAVLIDFGLSKQFDNRGEPESSTTIGLGTPGYAPIEQSTYEGEGFPVTMDIYAFGATMYKMLTGKSPNPSSEMLNVGFPYEELRDKGVSEKLIEIISLAMKPMVKDRYQSVEELLREMEGTEIGDGEDDIVEVKVDPVPDPNPRGRWIILLILSVILCFGGYYAYEVIDGKKAEAAKAEAERLEKERQQPGTAEYNRTHGSANGHDWVDLGLPSGLKWATCNVGAESPEDYGNYYAWGETTTKSTYTEVNSTTYRLSFSALLTQGIIDENNNLTPSHDAARSNWGGSWRLPTKAELEELENKCTWTWTTQNGVRGYKVTGPNGNSIFLPAAGTCYGSSLDNAGENGYYWSSTPNESNSHVAYDLSFNSGSQDVRWTPRRYGFSVRPVSE